MKPDVLSLGAFPPGMMATMRERFTLHHFVPTEPFRSSALPAEVRGRIRAIATEANRGATRELIFGLPKLEIVSCFGVGIDAIDLAAARERSIPVTNTPGVIADDVADLAIGMMIASLREMFPAERFVRDDRWNSATYGLAHKVTGKRLGILGLGAIGSAIATRAAGFAMKISYSDLAAKPGAPYSFVADPVELAKSSDVLIVACFGGPSTHHLVSAAVIDALGANGTLINVARGSVVDERALIAALQAGRLGAAALDVFEHEPNVPAELLAHPRVIVQPHMGTATVETRETMGQTVVDNISAKLAGQKLLTPV